MLDQCDCEHSIIFVYNAELEESAFLDELLHC